MLKALSYDWFAGCLHQQFQLAVPGGPTLKLIAVERARASLPGTDAFSLLFAGPDPLLLQDTYALTAPSQETVELFLVPVARVGSELHYEAIFN